jgi:hypothetical protein
MRLRLPGDGRRAFAGAFGAACVIGAIGVALLPTSVPRVRADVTLTPAGTTTGGRLVDASVRITPANALDGADWLRTVAWQGGGRVEGAPLRRTGAGTYVAREPIPVGGSWKAALRFHRGGAMASAVIYLPADPAIAGAREVPAARHFSRPFVADHLILQRERKAGATGILWTGAIIAVMGIVAVLFAGLGAALVRLSRAGAPAPEPVPAGRPLEVA